MSKMIKTSLVALSLLAGASVVYAANNDGGGRNDTGRSVDRGIDGPDVEEREKMLDMNPTGSIQTCETQSYDEFGNCIAGDQMQ